jgi:hypothetical protein
MYDKAYQLNRNLIPTLLPLSLKRQPITGSSLIWPALPDKGMPRSIPKPNPAVAKERSSWQMKFSLSLSIGKTASVTMYIPFFPVPNPKPTVRSSPMSLLTPAENCHQGSG